MKKERIFKGLLAASLAAVLLAGCSDRGEAPGEASAPSVEQSETEPVETPAEQPEAQELPPELLHWVAQSGWDIPPEVILAHILPAQDAIEPDYPDSYFVSAESHLYERQQGNSCGGYASAYLLRAMGEDVRGQQVYDAFGYKITDGLVLPQGIVDYFNDRGHTMHLYTGDLQQLKTRLYTGGQPVVLLVGSGLDYQHYIALVGYDADTLYFADSAREEAPGSMYNAALSEEEFLPLWENIIPGFERIYFVVE